MESHQTNTTNTFSGPIRWHFTTPTPASFVALRYFDGVAELQEERLPPVGQTQTPLGTPLASGVYADEQTHINSMVLCYVHIAGFHAPF